jgi:hypothetical protein
MQQLILDLTKVKPDGTGWLKSKERDKLEKMLFLYSGCVVRVLVRFEKTSQKSRLRVI